MYCTYVQKGAADNDPPTTYGDFMFEDNAILSQMANIIERYFDKPREKTDPKVVSLDFELALERQMAAVLTTPLEGLTK